MFIAPSLGLSGSDKVLDVGNVFISNTQLSLGTCSSLRTFVKSIYDWINEIASANIKYTEYTRSKQ